MKTNACPLCGSTSPRRLRDDRATCRNEEGCRERRCRRRQDEDAARAKREGIREQCHATHGHPSIKFCLLRVEHAGLHVNGTLEWGGREQHVMAQTIRAAQASASVMEPQK